MGAVCKILESRDSVPQVLMPETASSTQQALHKCLDGQVGFMGPSVPLASKFLDSKILRGSCGKITRELLGGGNEAGKEPEGGQGGRARKGEQRLPLLTWLPPIKVLSREPD